jgi:hypothetical protein
MGLVVQPHRLLEPIGYILPAEAEANYSSRLAERSAAMALLLKPTGLHGSRGGSQQVLSLAPRFLGEHFVQNGRHLMQQS